MKLNSRILMHSLIIVILVLLASSCNKNEDTNNPPDETSTILFNPSKTYGTVSDIDGNVYKTIVIGTQTWMAENLKTTKYRNGSPIKNVTDDNEWYNLNQPSVSERSAYCNYNNDANNSKVYGRLYNFYAAVDSRKIAPSGWHVPTDAEWTILTTFLGNKVGINIKEIGKSHWPEILDNETNGSGFTALPGGSRDVRGEFTGIGAKQLYDSGMSANWWSSSNGFAVTGLIRNMSISIGYNIVSSDVPSRVGASIRCIKD